MRSFWMGLVFVAVALWGAPALAGGGMNCGFGSWEDDETVRLYPTYAVWDADDRTVRIPIHVWVFESEMDRWRRVVVAGLAESLSIEDGTKEREIFERRMVDFLVDNESNKEVIAVVDDKRFRHEETSLGKTPGHGHLFATLELPLKKLRKPPEQVKLNLRIAGKGRLSGQTVHVPVVAETGLTVVSDIDDTVKQTNVLDRQEMFANTFTREFRGADELKPHFARWAARDATFHWVSASPWNVAQELDRFLIEAGFPKGVMHLRVLRPKEIDRTAKFLKGSRSHKLGEIRKLMRSFPERTFVLVGDSGEADPEVYAEIAREFPGRVESIVIRAVPGAENGADRFDAAFAGLDRARWEIVPVAADE